MMKVITSEDSHFFLSMCDNFVPMIRSKKFSFLERTSFFQQMFNVTKPFGVSSSALNISVMLIVSLIKR